MSLETPQQPEGQEIRVPTPEELEAAAAVKSAQEGATGLTEESHLAGKLIAPDGTLIDRDQVGEWDSK